MSHIHTGFIASRQRKPGQAWDTILLGSVPRMLISLLTIVTNLHFTRPVFQDVVRLRSYMGRGEAIAEGTQCSGFHPWCRGGGKGRGERGGREKERKGGEERRTGEGDKLEEGHRHILEAIPLLQLRSISKTEKAPRVKDNNLVSIEQLSSPRHSQYGDGASSGRLPTQQCLYSRYSSHEHYL